MIKLIKLFYFIIKKIRSREESEVAGFFVFSYIRMIGYFRSGSVRVNECSAGARKRRKATVEKRRKHTSSDSSLDPKIK